MCFSQRKGDLEKNGVLNHQAEQKRALYLQLGEKILLKAYEENKIEVQCSVFALLEHTRGEEKVRFYADDWLHFLDYLNAVVNLPKDKNNQTDEFI